MLICPGIICSLLFSGLQAKMSLQKCLFLFIMHNAIKWLTRKCIHGVWQRFCQVEHAIHINNLVIGKQIGLILKAFTPFLSLRSDLRLVCRLGIKLGLWLFVGLLQADCTRKMSYWAKSHWPFRDTRHQKTSKYYHSLLEICQQFDEVFSGYLATVLTVEQRELPLRV